MRKKLSSARTVSDFKETFAPGNTSFNSSIVLCATARSTDRSMKMFPGSSEAEEPELLRADMPAIALARSASATAICCTKRTIREESSRKSAGNSPLTPNCLTRPILALSGKRFAMNEITMCWKESGTYNSWARCRERIDSMRSSNPLILIEYSADAVLVVTCNSSSSAVISTTSCRLWLKSCVHSATTNLRSMTIYLQIKKKSYEKIKI